MPILPPNHHHSGRAPLAALLVLLTILGMPLLLLATAPQWWTSSHVYQQDAGTVPPASDYSPANLGQLKHFAVSAYEYVRTASGSYGDVTAPLPDSENPAEQKGGVGWRLRAALGQFVEFDTEGADPFAIKRQAGQIVRKTSAATADYAMLNQGQLKAVASLFYERLDAIYSPWSYPRPWGAETGAAEPFAVVTLGQLKHVFSFDLSKDSDGDGLSDQWEISVGLDPSFAGDATLDGDGDSLNNLAEFQNHTNPNAADSDADGMPDGWEVAHGLDPVDDDAHQDFDFDTAHNLTEYLYGTNPSDHYNGARPNIVPPQPTSASATVSNGELRVEWNDNSISETAFAIYKRTIDNNGDAVFQLLGRETPAAILFEKTIAPDEVVDGDHIVVIAEPSSTPPPIYVAAVVNQPFLVRFDQSAEDPIITYILEGNTILWRKPAAPVRNPPTPTMSVTRTPKKADIGEVEAAITSDMYQTYHVWGGMGPVYHAPHVEKAYSTVALIRVEGEDWFPFAAPDTDNFEQTESVGIGKVNTFAVYTGRDYYSSGGLSTYLDEEFAGVSGSVSAYFPTDPYDPNPIIPTLNEPNFWASHAGEWFHRPFDITQTDVPDHSIWPAFLGSWNAEESTANLDGSFVGAGIYDLSGGWLHAGGWPEGVELAEDVNIWVDGSFSYPLAGNNHARRFIVPRAWGTVSGTAAKRFDSLADSYPTFFAIPAEPGTADSFDINLHANVPDAAQHGTKWTISASGGVTFSDGSASKEYDVIPGASVGFKATTHGEIEFRFGGAFAGKIIVKAYPRVELRVLHVGITHIDPSTNEPSKYSSRGVKLQVANDARIPDETATDEVWIYGGPNIKVKHIKHQTTVKVLYKTKNNTNYEPDYTSTDASELVAALTAGTASVRQAAAPHDIVCYWLFHPNGSAEPGIGPMESGATIMFYNAGDNSNGYSFAHELGHTLGLLHPFAWIDNALKPADPGMMIMGYYSGTGFPGSQIDAVREYLPEVIGTNP